ncbi:MAG TPA: hypothetical protein VFR23_17865 [Jiangellaceae bacterium]|nr:hypothetical protein [Jiangellaceae bacterium]
MNILDLIDNALEDYSLSGDAMRWTPEPASGSIAESPTAGMTEEPPTRLTIDEIHEWSNTFMNVLTARMREVADAVGPALATISDEVRTAAVETRVPWIVEQDEPNITRDDIRWKTPLPLPPFELAVRALDAPLHPGIVTALPSPQPAGDILTNIRRAYRLMQPPRVVESDLLPDGVAALIYNPPDSLDSPLLEERCVIIRSEEAQR